jgi:hypothetical protein
MRLIDLQKDMSAHFRAQRVGEVFLFAVPRGQEVDLLLAELAGEEWLRNVPAGSLQSAPLLTPEGKLFPGHPGDVRRRHSEIVYRVKMKDGILEVICIAWKRTSTKETDWGLGPAVVFFLMILGATAAVTIYLSRQTQQRKAS